jgi:hypothetical protein
MVCYDETEGYKLLVSRSAFDDVVDQVNYVTGFKIPRFTEQLLWTTMSDLDYGDFPSFYENDPVLFMIRDYRDVIHSMAKLRYPDGQTWLQKYGLNILSHQENCPASTEENRQLLASIKMAGAPDHLVGALYWKYKTEAVFGLVELDKPVLPISYESLVANPRVELERMLNFMGLDWEDSLLEHSKHQHSELDENGLAIGGTDPKRAIHSNSIQSYKSFFSAKELEEMQQIVNSTLSSLKVLKIEFI